MGMQISIIKYGNQTEIARAKNSEGGDGRLQTGTVAVNNNLKKKNNIKESFDSNQYATKDQDKKDDYCYHQCKYAEFEKDYDYGDLNNYFAANEPVDGMVLVPSQPNSDTCGGNTEAKTDTMKEVNMSGSGENLIDNENIDDG